jgi:hypothetical protein
VAGWWIGCFALASANRFGGLRVIWLPTSEGEVESKCARSMPEEPGRIIDASIDRWKVREFSDFAVI